MPGIDQARPFVPLKIAVLTVSDTRELALRFLRSIVDGDAATKQGPAVVTERGMGNQLHGLRLRPQACRHLTPIVLIQIGAVGSRRLWDHSIRGSLHELPVSPQLPAAIRALVRVPPGVAHGGRSERGRLLPVLARRGHKCVEFIVVEVFVQWTSQVQTLLYRAIRDPVELCFSDFPWSSPKSVRVPRIWSRMECFILSMTLPTPLAPSPMPGREAISRALMPCRK